MVVLWGVQRAQSSWASQSDGSQEKMLLLNIPTSTPKRKINMFHVSISK